MFFAPTLFFFRFTLVSSEVYLYIILTFFLCTLMFEVTVDLRLYSALPSAHSEVYKIVTHHCSTETKTSACRCQPFSSSDKLSTLPQDLCQAVWWKWLESGDLSVCLPPCPSHLMKVLKIWGLKA